MWVCIIFTVCRLLLRHSFSELHSVQVAVIHCSAQTTATHVLQKLAQVNFILLQTCISVYVMQVCMVISTNTGRVYRPRDCERLILFLKDINLPKPDKWGTSQLISFLQQVNKHACMCVIAVCMSATVKLCG